MLGSSLGLGLPGSLRYNIVDKFLKRLRSTSTEDLGVFLLGSGDAAGISSWLLSESSVCSSDSWKWQCVEHFLLQILKVSTS